MDPKYACLEDETEEAIRRQMTDTVNEEEIRLGRTRTGRIRCSEPNLSTVGRPVRNVTDTLKELGL